jgi:hypothetical protein
MDSTGNLRFDTFPDAALRHYRIGKAIGELSPPPGFQDLLQSLSTKEQAS